MSSPLILRFPQHLLRSSQVFPYQCNLHQFSPSGHWLRMTFQAGARAIHSSQWLGGRIVEFIHQKKGDALGVATSQEQSLTRISTFLVGDPYKTFICHCYWERATPRWSISVRWFLFVSSNIPPLQGTSICFVMFFPYEVIELCPYTHRFLGPRGRP